MIDKKALLSEKVPDMAAFFGRVDTG